VIANASVLAIGGWLVIDGQLTLAQLVAAEIVVSSVAAGIGKLGKYLEAFYDLAAATDKVAHVLTPSTDFHQGTDKAPSTRPEVLLRFHEVQDDRADLDGANLEIGKGQLVGVHHPAPLPLRPLAELLTATRSPDRGHLELLGIDCRELARAEILEHVAMINRCEVFPGSVYENVSVHRPDATKTVVRAALEAVDLLQPMLDLPSGLETDLEEHGHFLAPGQRWRLMLARALAHKCPLIVIETIPPELTSREFRDLLRRLHGRVTEDGAAVLLFTDNEEVLQGCDHAVELREGRFETWGGHQ
jgi:putative ABC transport system ATP-binding protein